MGGGNKVDVMCSFFLKSQHFGRKFIGAKRADGMLMKLLTDLVILTKNTAQVAANEEYGSRAPRS